ncbi:MAG TPA: protein tyrosine phosphatase [Prolixibacteraceae bacterium]|nr:protein tyrosine phosphatase [Prolixibacteraceae bacterium]
MRILIICRANSCRSQMAEAILKRLDPNLVVESAGPEPAEAVHPGTIRAMAEIGIDISQSSTTNITEFVKEDWDFVITVCDIARESCPAFIGNVKNSIYLKFEDPLAYEGDDEFLLKLIRTTRTQIVNEFEDFYNEYLTSK